MDAEQVLKLFDTYWFETTIFTNKTSSPFHSTLDSTSRTQVLEVLRLDTKLTRIPTLQVRSFSDQNLGSKVDAFSDSLSPDSVLTPQKLRTILSGKEVREFPLEKGHGNHEDEEEEVTTKKKLISQSHRRRLRKGKTTRSLSNLEFKELKGFMDLGFVFSEEDKDSRLVSLIPGLQRLGRDEARESTEQQNIDETVIYRPYLSEAWGILDQRKVVNPLLNWRVPTPSNEIDMKDNLRFWAHTVASIVR
ncbi:uncharacterized protein LOC133298003 [Gastrolobium bilobum]|uniref:uncharacterized protein LOC133298003 n=1 Tax=Gastrolobium bilobum TaxID=150636 RepID=UPI002AAF8CC1|nr:uncharacterized protein LOC133298003 [Gastrolobium bilobum]